MLEPSYPSPTPRRHRSSLAPTPPSVRRHRYRPTPAEIERLLALADELTRAGAVEPEICRALGISPRVYDLWRRRRRS
jgi:hypothetical protein